MEKWKDVTGYKGIYEVSNKGKVRSVDRYVSNRPGGKSKRLVKGRILKSYLAGAGYEYVTLSVNQSKENMLVHRLVLAAFVGEGDLTVHHKNENKTDNRLKNLEYVTQKENCNLGTRNQRLSEIKKEHYKSGVYQHDELGRFK